MTEPRLIERWRMRRAVARRQRRPLWRRSALGRRRVPAEEFLVIPSDLRATDPSFAAELTSGHMGLAGTSMTVGESSPFTITHAPIAWQAALHGFAWLAHLAAAQTIDARDMARERVSAWIDTTPPEHALAWETPILARRVISWINHASLLIDGVEPAAFDRVMQSLDRQLKRLGEACTFPGRHRLEGLTALVLADLAIKDQDSHLAIAERELLAELPRQILDDGCHASRNPETGLDLLLDLLPLRQAYAARERALPPALQDTIERMIAFLHSTRLGDGRLCCMNGAARRRLEDLSTVLLFGASVPPKPGVVPASRYLRVESGKTIILMDGGAAPRLEHSAAAAAGCLAFEMSDGAEAMFVNPGPGQAPSAAPSGIAVWRATSAQNTLALAEQSSARFVVTPDAKALSGGAALVGPPDVTATTSGTADGQTIEASHDGYMAAFGLRHTREIALAPGGHRVTGRDSLAGKSGTLRLKQDVPVAVYFYLHLDAEIEAAASSDRNSLDHDASGGTGLDRNIPEQRSVLNPNVLEIRLAGGSRWRLTVEGATPRHETIALDSLRTAARIVLRTTCNGETTITWTLEKLAS